MSDYTENETTAITLQPVQPNLARFGDRSELLVMFNRIRSMVQGADKAPEPIIWAAAQKAIAHGLDLFDDEIYLMEVKGKWTAHVGIRGLRRNADGKFYFEDSDDYPRRLSEEELKADMGGTYKAGCIGVEVRLYNLPKAREAKEIGIPYFPRKERGYFSPGDQIPATRTGAWVAQKRAEKMALRAEFSLKFQKDRDEEEIIAHLQRKLRDKDREEAPIARPQLTDDDRKMDAMLFDDEPAPADFVDDMPDEDGDFEEGDYRQPEESFDNPWDDELPADDDERQPETRGDTIKPATLRQLHKLGREVYGEGWDAKRAKLVESVSTGAATSSNELLESEAQKLIAGMQAKAAAKAQPVTA